MKKFGRVYSKKSSDWISNAIDQHQHESFGAIIAQESKRSYILSAKEFDEDDLKDKDRGRKSLTLMDLISEFDIFLRFGDRIAFVDPYFRIDRKKKDDSVRCVFSRCLKTVKKFNPSARCEIHYRNHDKMPSISQIRRNSSNVSCLIPSEMNITIYCWRKCNSIEFHDRYLLTDKGGLVIPGGFRIKDGEKTSASYWSAEEAEKKLKCFDLDGSGHHLVDKPLRIYSNGLTNILSECTDSRT